LLELLVGLLQFLLLRLLQLLRPSCWDCFSSPSVCMVASMLFSTMADAVGELLEEGHLRGS